MKRSYAVYQVDAFTKEKLSGNPAGVVLDARGLTDEEMRRIARELNNSETAFILPGKPGEYDVQVRFFTPAKEVPVCGHATIASHYVRAMELGLDSARVVQKCGAGIFAVDVCKENGDYRVVMSQGRAVLGEPLVHARMFGPANGVAEDPVTGIANGPMGAYLVRNGLIPAEGDEVRFTAVQGEAMGRPGSMEVRVALENGQPGEIQIVGDAVVAFRTTLELDP